jgi:site-specific DNA recombinase
MMKAALYARYSTDKQRDASIDDQFRECARVARAAGFDVVAQFEDKSMSGGTADRPGYQELLSAARRKQFDVIVVEDISRLWRNRAEFGPRSAEFEDLGVHCVTAVGDDTRRDGWGLVIQIKQAVAEHARREASYRTRRGLEGKAIKGESAGGRAYGYMPASQSSTGQVEIIEAEAAIVRRIFELYATGCSSRTIAERLNAENIPSPGAAWKRTDTGEHAKRRGKWVGSAIHGDQRRGYGILNNERYIGRLNWGRLQWKRGAANSNKRTAIAADPASLVIREEPRLQIISDELWHRVKARQSAQSIGPHGTNPSKAGKPATTLLSGLLLCEDCGSRFIASDQYSYQCATRTYGGLSACSNKVRVKRARAEAAIVDYIAEELLSPEAVDIAKRAYQEAIRKELGTREHAKVKGAGTLHAEEAQLREMLRAGTLSPDVARAALDAVERKRRTIATALRMPAARSAEAFSLGLERYRDAVRNLGKHVPYSDQAAEERRLVRELLGGHGTVFTRDGRIGARFRSAGLLDMEEFSYKSKIYNCGSGGRI